MKIKSKLLIPSAILFTAIAVGCSEAPPKEPSYSSYVESGDVDLTALTMSAAEQLIKNSQLSTNDERPILATSFVNIDNLTESSTLGRTLSELFVSGLTQQGIKVTEVKMREGLYIREQQGELALSRKLDRISRTHDAKAVLIGTYGIGGQNIYVNARLVRTADNIILGSRAVTVPITRDIKAMIASLRRR